MYADGKRMYDLVSRMGFVRVSGSPEEEKAAAILMEEAKKLGFEAEKMPFEVEDGTVLKAQFRITGGKEYTVTGYKCAKSTDGEETAPFFYLEQFDDVCLQKAKGKFVLVNERPNPETYQKLLDAGVKGFMTMGGTVIDEEDKTDLDTRKLRKNMTDLGLLPAFHIRMTDALDLLKQKPETVSFTLETKNHVHISHNVLVTVKGTDFPDEIIDIGAHYDSVEFSYGVWDNAAGCATIMELLHYFKENPPKRTLRFIWFGSEELGLLGSKAYTAKYKDEFDRHVLMINADVGGSILGRNQAIVTADHGLCTYIEYLAKEVGYSTTVKYDVMSSDSTPFADCGVPAISFARGGGQGMGFMHTRYDMISLISEEGLQVVADFAIEFAKRVVNAEVFPVPKKIPDEIVEKVDRYLFKKKED